MTSYEHLARLHAADLHADAAAFRRERECRRRERRAPVALRLYARIWWASRPRAAAWTPALFDPSLRPS